ncbi:hypothetical protein HPB50_011297 [Hyalomma asiaticum]|uniref:Uncharacterized protein n=1 Tax=Hyalomma asiaticum TaxID=266040 RepID=A0ACB7SQ07_HYAAI|nr:hypothetical protein HPB50_011297 [Hyalomma asiaticum]
MDDRSRQEAETTNDYAAIWWTVKRATWADTIKGSGGATSTGQKNTADKITRGEAQSEHVNDPRIQSLEAENLQLRRELAELKEALNSIREQFSHRDEDKFKALSPLAGKPKRKAPYPGTVSETDGEDEMAEPSEDTAAAAIPPAKTKTRGKLASIEKTLGCMMEMLSGMEDEANSVRETQGPSQKQTNGYDDTNAGRPEPRWCFTGEESKDVSGSGKRVLSSGSGGQFTKTDSTSAAKSSADELSRVPSSSSPDKATKGGRLASSRRSSKGSKGGSSSDTSRGSQHRKKCRKQKRSPPTEEASSTSEANRKSKQLGKRSPETSTSPDGEGSS